MARIVLTTIVVLSLTNSTHGADPSFASWLNGQRAAAGLPPVIEDANLAAWAVQNSVDQHNRGTLGHNVRAGRRQNAGFGSLPQVCVMWMNSPLHRAAILDPTVRRFGLGYYGVWWTLNLD